MMDSYTSIPAPFVIGAEAALAIVVGDGLSSIGVAAHGSAIIEALLDRLSGWSVAPIVVARQARVAIGDEIGAAMGVKIVVVLIGERPGLSSQDSVSAYITWNPRRSRRNDERSCVSNIHPPHGLSYAEAASKIASICTAARTRERTGVELNEVGDVRLTVR